MSRCFESRSRGRAARDRRSATLAIVALAAIVAMVGWTSGAVNVGPRAAYAQQPRAQGKPTAAKRDSLAVTSQEYLGWKYFHVYCYRCHGVDAFGGQLAPDLRHSVGPQGSVTHEVFLTTVKEGRLTKGMPTWKALLTDEQIEGLWAYLQARSSGRLAPGRPHVAGTSSK